MLNYPYITNEKNRFFLKNYKKENGFDDYEKNNK